MIKIEPIENGTVIDHIRSGKGKKVLEILGIGEEYPGRVALMINVPSKKLGKKDIVKIEGKEVSEKLANMIALISDKCSINIIKAGKVCEKRDVTLPKELSGIGSCPNPNCVTNYENALKRFSMEVEYYFCHYCERAFKAEELL